jgi:hypothetical protein
MSIHRNTVPLFSIANFQPNVSVEEAVNRLTKNDCLQPVLMKCGERVWVKLDYQSTPVSASCFANYMEYS